MKTINNKSVKYFMETIKNNPHNLKYVPKDHRSFYRLAETAVKINGSTLQYIPKNYGRYDKLALLALNSEILRMKYYFAYS